MLIIFKDKSKHSKFMATSSHTLPLPLKQNILDQYCSINTSIFLQINTMWLSWSFGQKKKTSRTSKTMKVRETFWWRMRSGSDVWKKVIFTRGQRYIFFFIYAGRGFAHLWLSITKKNNSYFLLAHTVQCNHVTKYYPTTLTGIFVWHQTHPWQHQQICSNSFLITQKWK